MFSGDLRNILRNSFIEIYNVTCFLLTLNIYLVLEKIKNLYDNQKIYK